MPANQRTELKTRGCQVVLKYLKVSPPPFLSPQAQKSTDISRQKLRLLKMSLENRLEEFPNLAETIKDEEQNGEGLPPVFPRPTPLTGTFYIKLHGVEGLLDFQILRQISGNDLQPMSSPRTYSTGSAILKNTARFMTLPTPSHREREREKEREREREREKEEEGLTSSTGSTYLWPRKGSRHGKSKTTLQKQHSLDNITDDSCKPGAFLGKMVQCLYVMHQLLS